MIAATESTQVEESLTSCDSPFAFLKLDQRRVVTHCSVQFVDLFGDSVEGQSFDQLISLDDRSGHASYLSRLSTYRGGYLDTFSSLSVLERQQLCRIRMRRESDLGWTVVVELLDEEDEVRQLLQSRERQKAVTRNASEGVAFLDRDSRIVEHNPRFLQICTFRSKHGVVLNEASIKGRRLSELATDEFGPLVDALLQEDPRQRRYSDHVRTDSRLLHVTLTPTFLARSQFGGCVVVVKDMTSEEELNRLRVDNARRSGQAEIATSILHNVGNSLNSLSIGQQVLIDLLQGARFEHLAQAIDLLDCDNPAAFLETEKGQKCIPCLRAISNHQLGRRDQVLTELKQLGQHIAHIQAIVAKQQRHARSTAATEACTPEQLLEDAIKIALAGEAGAGVAVEREWGNIGEFPVDRHRVIEILVNLLTNSHESVLEQSSEKKIVVSSRLDEEGNIVMGVRDNGAGISEENLTKIFSRGYTTKKDGHGYGLHSSACIAAELGGRLVATSDGPGKGAQFDLVLPKNRTASVTFDSQQVF